MSYAIMLREPGGPDQLRWERVEVPRPGRNEVRVRHTAIGVNFHDTYVRSGLYKTLPLPGIPGLEAVGIVEEVGPGVGGLGVGDRIVYIDVGYGAYTQARILSAALALPIPSSISDEAGAAITLKGMTACMLLRHVHKVAPGQTILIHAAAGAMGQLLCCWAKHLGAMVIATVGSPEKAAVARACGADHVILYRDEPFPDRVREITKGRGVDVAYDSVGKDTFLGSLECLDYLGHLVNFGQASGPVAPLNVPLLAAKSITLTRPLLFHYIRGREALEHMAGETFDAVAAGVIRPEIGLNLPLAKAAEAHRALESRATTGSVVLTP